MTCDWCGLSVAGDVRLHVRAWRSECDLASRAGLWAAQRGLCGWCAEPMPPPASNTVDHVIPRSRNGPDRRWNVQLVHGRCNTIKGSRITARAWELAAEHDVRIARYRTGAARGADSRIHVRALSSPARSLCRAWLTTSPACQPLAWPADASCLRCRAIYLRRIANDAPEPYALPFEMSARKHAEESTPPPRVVVPA